jgi:molybdopterin-guanine dinucleotide biosynthesis protein B
MTHVCGFFGAPGVGKTTLIAGVAAALRAQGLRVSVLRHVPAGVPPAPPGSEARTLHDAGAFEVMLAGPRRLATTREFEADLPFTVHDLLAEFSPCDFILVEGFDLADIHRIELWRPGRAPVYPDDPFVIGVVLDDPQAPPEPTMRPLLARGDVQGVADLLLRSTDRLAWPPDASADAAA